MDSLNQARIHTLLITDMVGSTELTAALGDAKWAAISSRCDAAARRVFAEHGGREIDKSDGFLILFDRPIYAVRAALAFHREMQALSAELGQTLQARAGVHLGEVISRDNSPEEVAKGAKPIEVEGLAKPMAARMMALAGPRQTLIGAGAFELARRAAVGDDHARHVRWVSHGPYSLKGIEEWVEVFEAGEEGVAPLSPPPDSEKAKSMAALDQGIVTGWRPSVGADVPSAPGWVCMERLGAGAFGEVWKVVRRVAPGGTETKVGALDRYEAGTELAFKFCFDLAHARALRREATLFKMIQQRFGHHPGIVRLLDFQLEVAPLFLAMEYVAGRNVAEWIEEEGKRLPLGRRLRLFSSIAGTIAEIHAAGIILSDIKPSNILVRYGKDGSREFVLADLGVGRLREKSLAADAAVTKTTGFTKTNLTMDAPISGGEDSGGGTLLYLAPEVMEGTVPNVATDAYALGVTLFQVAAGNARLAVAEHWRRHVPSGPARALIGRMLRGDPRKRLSNFPKIEKALRRMPGRIRRWNVVRIATALFVILLIGLHVWWFGIYGPSRRYKADELRKQLQLAGVPTSPEEFNTKYPVTRRGEAAILEIIPIVRQIGLPTDSQVPWHATWIDPVPIPVSMESLFEFRTSAFQGDSRLDFEKIQPQVEENRAFIDRLAPARRLAPPPRELCWRLDIYNYPPYPTSPRGLGGDKIERWFLLFRTIARELVPASIAEHLRKGDVSGAYEELLGWRHAYRAVMGQTDTLVGGMIGAAVLALNDATLLALLETHPPDEETCNALLKELDPALIDGGISRSVDVEIVNSLAFAEFVEGKVDRIPNSFGGGYGSSGMTFTIGMTNSKIPPVGRRVLDVIARFYSPPVGADARWKSYRIYLITDQMARNWSWETHKKLVDEISELAGSNLVTAIGIAGYNRIFLLSRQHQSRSAAIGTLVRLRMLELRSKDAASFLPPATLSALDSADGNGIPKDYTRVDGQLGYELLPDLGIVRISHDQPDVANLPKAGEAVPKQHYFCPYGARTLEATVIGPEPMIDKRTPIETETAASIKARAEWNKSGQKGPMPAQVMTPTGVFSEVPVDAAKRRNHVLRVRLESGRELRVVCPDFIAQAIGFPGKFPPGTRVRLAKRPLMLDNEIVFEIATTQDIELAP